MCYAGDATLATLIPEMRELSARLKDDTDALARQSYHLVEHTLAAKPFSQVTNAFHNQKVQLVDAWVDDIRQNHEYLVLSNATSSAGLSFDVFVRITTLVSDQRTNSTNVLLAHAQSDIRIVPDTTVDDMYAKGWLNHQSSIGRVIDDHTVRTRSPGYDLLHSVRLRYCHDRNRRELVWPYGYAIDVTFLRRARTNESSYAIYCWVLSREDLPTDRQGASLNGSAPVEDMGIDVDTYLRWIPDVRVLGWRESGIGVRPKESEGSGRAATRGRD
jgi:hypothetical protein